MAILGYKPILEIPSRELYAPTGKKDHPLTLEQAILQDFNKKGLKNFREYGVQAKVPINTDVHLEFSREDLTKDYGFIPVIGKIYTFSRPELNGICGGNARCTVEQTEHATQVMLYLILDQASISGYLRLVFPLLRKDPQKKKALKMQF